MDSRGIQFAIWQSSQTDFNIGQQQEPMPIASRNTQSNEMAVANANMGADLNAHQNNLNDAPVTSNRSQSIHTFYKTTSEDAHMLNYSLEVGHPSPFSIIYERPWGELECLDNEGIKNWLNYLTNQTSFCRYNTNTALSFFEIKLPLLSLQHIAVPEDLDVQVYLQGARDAAAAMNLLVIRQKEYTCAVRELRVFIADLVSMTPKTDDQQRVYVELARLVRQQDNKEEQVSDWIGGLSRTVLCQARRIGDAKENTRQYLEWVRKRVENLDREGDKLIGWGCELLA